MKLSFTIFLFSLIACSFASYLPEAHLSHDDDEFIHLPNFTKIIEEIKPTLQYQLNFSIDPSNSSNFMGVHYTTQQFSSLFPLMKSIQPAQNVTFNIFLPLNPFKLLNVSGYKVNVDFNAHVTVLLKNGKINTPWTSANLTGFLTLEVVNIVRGMHLQVSDWQINNVIVPDSEKVKINVPNLLDTINGIGYLGIDKVNNKLSEKPIPGSAFVAKVGTWFQDHFLMETETESQSEFEVVYKDNFVTVTMNDFSEKGR